MPTKPAQGHINWTTGLNTQVTDPGAKKAIGWIVDDIPPFEFENWLQWTNDLWDKYLEAITDLHITQIAALTTTVGTLGAASGITASNAGHTTMVGTNVQAQLDQADAAFKDLFDAITGGEGIDLVGYVPAVPADWSPAPTRAGPAIDQLASRVKVLENAGGIGTFIDDSFADYVIPAVNNTGLTDNGNTNPRGLKFNELQTFYGTEYIHFLDLQATGNADAAGNPEYAIVTHKGIDKRIMAYGSHWSIQDNDGNGRRLLSTRSGDYLLFTGVMDGFALMLFGGGGTDSNQIDIQRNGVSTGFMANPREIAVFTGKNWRSNSIVSDPSMYGFSQDLMTWKVVNGSSDSGLNLQIFGFVTINTALLQMGGSAYVDKAVVNYAKASPSPIAINQKGGSVWHYIDRADTLIKQAKSEPAVFETTATSIGSGSSGATVASGSGFAANYLALIKDAAFAEIIRIGSAGPTAITFGGGQTTQNSYTSPQVNLYAKILAACDHSLEEVKSIRYFAALGDRGGVAYTEPSTSSFGVTGRADYIFDDNCTQHTVNDVTRPAIYNLLPGLVVNSFSPYLISFVGTGLDLLLDNLVTTNTYQVYVDGNLCGVLSFGTKKTAWYKIVSDLPYGHHHVKILPLNGGGSNDVAFVAVKEYVPKQPAAVLAAKPGDVLAKRHVVGTYSFLNQGVDSYAVSQIQSCLIREAYMINGTGGTVDWASQVEGSNTTISFASDYAFFTDRGVGTKVIKWFYGNGVDLIGRMNTDGGIIRLKIDGNNLTAANFPSAAIKGTSSFNFTTGLWDMYAASLLEQQIVSVSALALGWHCLEVDATGTKNGSSSNFITHLSAVRIHGTTFFSESSQVAIGHPGSSINIGGMKDLRHMDPLQTLGPDVPLNVMCNDFNDSDVFSANPGSTGPIVLSPTHKIFKSNGGLINVDISVMMSNAAAGQAMGFAVFLNGEAVNDAEFHMHSAAAGYTNTIGCSFSKILPPGEHTVWVDMIPVNNTMTIYRSILNIKETVVRRAL